MKKLNYLRLFQNANLWFDSRWNSANCVPAVRRFDLRFNGKNGYKPVFPRACFKTNRVLKQVHLFLFTVLLYITACNDPVFFSISKEPELLEPRIKGSPSNFASYKNTMYVASGDRLYYYKNPDGDNLWDEVKPFNGYKITQIAATEKYLYALIYKDSVENIEFSLRRFEGEAGTGKWDTVSTDNADSTIRNIYAANDVLFAGGGAGEIWYIDDKETNTNNAIKKLRYSKEDKEVSGKISGTAFGGGWYYLCTTDNGIYGFENPSTGAVPASGTGLPDKITFLGIINLQDVNNTIVSINRTGELFTVKEGTISKVGGVFLIHLTTGALAVWSDPQDTSRRLLLAGRQDNLSTSTASSYTYGYMEIELDSNGGIKSGSNFTEPGKSGFSSVNDHEGYLSTIGKHSVSYIYQAPHEIDKDMTLFASTQQEGVWSYRERLSVWQWNAEE